MSVRKLGQLASAVSKKERTPASERAKAGAVAKPKSGSETRESGSAQTSAKSKKSSTARPREGSDRVEAVSAGSVELLDLDPAETRSDPGAAREVTAAQASTARRATGETDESSEFDALVAEEKDDPADAAQIAPPEALAPGSEIPPVPELPESARTASTENPLIGHQETFQVDGVEYTRTTDGNGRVRTEYEVDGITYSESRFDDGTRNVHASRPAGSAEASHVREVRYDADGRLVEDRTQSTQGETDLESGEFRFATRTETLAGDGTRSISEVNESDGRPTSVVSRTEGPDGGVRTARLDLPAELDHETFTEQLTNFAQNGDPELLNTALTGLEPEQLEAVSSNAFRAGNPAIYEFIEAASAAASVSGPGGTGRLASGLHEALTDESLLEGNHNDAYFHLFKSFQSVGAAGGDVALGVELVDRLRVTSEGRELSSTLASDALNGPSGNGLGVLEGVVDGLAFHSNGFGRAADRVDQLNRDISYLTANFGPFMTPEELTAAQEEFREQYADDYQAYQDMSAGVVANVNNIQRLEEMRAEYRGDNSRHNPFAGAHQLDTVSDNLLTRVRQASGTEQGRAEIAAELERAGRGQESFLTDLNALGSGSEEANRERELLETSIFDAGFAHAAQAAASGDLAGATAQLDGLGATHPDLTSEHLKLLEELANGTADLNEAFPDLLDVPEDPELSDRLRRAGAILGIAGLANNGIDIASGNADVQTLIGTLADGTELGTQVFEDVLSQTFSRSSVQTAGRVAGGVGVLLSAVGTVQSLADGDVASAGLNLAATVGGALTLSSSTAVTGVGAIITVAALAGQIGLAQYRSVEASNHFERPDTERFLSRALDDADLTDAQRSAVLTELRNADSQGRLTGILLQQAADQAGLTPREFLTQIAQLSPREIHHVVTTGHGVDPQNNDPNSLDPDEVAEFLEFVRSEYDVAT